MSTSEEIELITELEEKGLTLEQYRAALLNTFMYLDIFTNDEKNGYCYEEISNEIEAGMTIDDLLQILGRYARYTDRNSTRQVYYSILTDAVKKDVAFGNFEVSYMSRRMTREETGMEFNEGTNAMIFIDPIKQAVYVTYRGTSKGEWGDNCERFNCKNIHDLTPQMEQTLCYFEYVAKQMGWTQESIIYVTGHSQGGNDAQISLLLSPYGKFVNACFSFDGEGHSPELLEDVKRLYGVEEYENRINRMYSICGEYDFVNHLGEKVILESNTIYIHCNIDKWTKVHDITSMFCDESFCYNGMINTSKGTAPSWVTHYTAQVWEELCKMPDDMRASCQAAVMQLAEGFVSGGKCWVGLNGECASLNDYAVFLKYGVSMLIDSAGKTVLQIYMDKMVNGYACEVINKIAETGLISKSIAIGMKDTIREMAKEYLNRYGIKKEKKQYKAIEWDIDKIITICRGYK